MIILIVIVIVIAIMNTHDYLNIKTNNPSQLKY